MVGLLPCQENSPAPRLIPGTSRSASLKLVTPRSSSSLLVTTVMDCGVSRMGVAILDIEVWST